MRNWIEKLLQSRHLSLTQMAARLGYKSKTSLARLMDGHVRDSSIRDFEQRALDSLDLTREERASLHDAAQIKMYGQDNWETDREMWAYLRQEPLMEPAGPMVILDAETGKEIDLNAVLPEMEDLRMDVFNCQGVPMYDSLRLLMSRQRVRVTHYLRCGATGQEVLRDLRCLIPVFYNKDYRIFVNSESAPATTDGLAKADTLILSFRLNGEEREGLIHFVQPCLGMCLNRVGPPGAFRRLISPDTERYREVKAPLYTTADVNSPASYIDYLQMCADIEADRTALILRPTPPFNTIPPEICEAALTQDFPADVRGTLRAIQDRRFSNLHNKRKQTHMTVKRGALRHLALTGTTPDHFWGMRPFTPQERVRWLERLLGEHLTNPFFHLHILRDDSVVSDLEFSWYEGVGLLNVPGNSTYDLAAGHAEALITNPTVVNRFHDFYLKQLVMSSCYAESAVSEILRGLISLACGRMERGEDA